jgi:hypothetical protein
MGKLRDAGAGIGALVRACEAGRRDARHGKVSAWPHEATRWFYRDGYRREQREMRRTGRLPQMALDIG